MYEIKVLSLFSGCGGMDLGIEGGFSVHRKSVSLDILKICSKGKDTLWVRLPRTKFKVIFSNDILREAKAAYVPFFNSRGSNHPFTSDSIVDIVKKVEAGQFQFPNIDVVIGGFPCQDFSLAGKRLGLNSNKSHIGMLAQEISCEENRGQLYVWMKKVIEMTKPRVFIAENVKGLVSLGNVKKIIENDFCKIDNGYVVNAKVLRAGNYGVPQTRERVIFIGVNKRYLTEKTINDLESGIIDVYPPKTHYLPNEKDKNLLPFVCVSDVLLDLPEPDYAVDLAQKAYSKAKFYGKHVQGQLEVNLQALGPTIRAEHHGNIEFRRLGIQLGGKYSNEIKSGKKQRRLTVRECARIQTFPDEFEFIRAKNVLGPDFSLSPSNAYKVIGNAVPPLLGFNVAWNLQEKWCQIFN